MLELNRAVQLMDTIIQHLAQRRICTGNCHCFGHFRVFKQCPEIKRNTKIVLESSMRTAYVLPKLFTNYEESERFAYILCRQHRQCYGLLHNMQCELNCQPSNLAYVLDIFVKRLIICCGIHWNFENKLHLTRILWNYCIFFDLIN